MQSSRLEKATSCGPSRPASHAQCRHRYIPELIRGFNSSIDLASRTVFSVRQTNLLLFRCCCLQTVTVEAGDAKAVKQSTVDGDQSASSAVVTCKLLDCDTISQVKAKILDALYANTPFSCRPSVDDIELCECYADLLHA